MKNRFLYICVFLLTLFSFNIECIADDYLTITFTDDRPKQYFYLCDIDSMLLSKVALDSLENSEWCVQEIWIAGSAYRYPLDLIQSIDIKKVDKEQMVRSIVEVDNAVGPLFFQCNSTSELEPYLPQIRQLDDVEDAWIDSQTLFVRIKDAGVITYLYPEKPEFNFISEVRQQKFIRKLASTLTANNSTKSKVAVIVNQMWRDDNWSESTNNLNETESVLKDYIFKVNRAGNNPNISFYETVLPQADLVFLDTHGAFDGNTHYLLTGEEFFTSDIAEQELSPEVVYELYTNKYYPHGNQSDKPLHLDYGWVKEKHGKNTVRVYYRNLSEHTIKRIMPSFHNYGNVIMFNTACQSLKGNEELGNLFLNKGAACYLGYDETDSGGTEAGLYFLGGMLMGTSANEAYANIPADLKTEHRKDPQTLKPFLSNLKLLTKSGGDIYLTYPDKPQYEIEQEDEESFSVNLKGSMVMYDPFDYMYGFMVSKNPDMTDAEEYVFSSDDEECQFDKKTYTLLFETTLTEDELEPGTRYYVKAVRSNGDELCESEEVEKFITPSLFHTYTGRAQVDGFNVTLYGSVEGIGPDVKPVQVGFLISENGDPWEEVAMFASAGTIGPSKEKVEFNKTLTSLKPNVTYSYVACVAYDGYYYYDTDTEEFYVGLQVNTDYPTNVRSKSATLNGFVNVSSDMSEDYGVVGFFYGSEYPDNRTFVSAGSLQQAIENDGSFSANITDLTPGEEYLYQAVLITGTNTIYADNTSSFLTPEPQFYWDMVSVTDITYNSALVSIVLRSTIDFDEYSAGIYVKKEGEAGKGEFHAIPDKTCSINLSDLDEDTEYVIIPAVWYDGEEIHYEGTMFTTPPEHPEKKPGLIVDLGLSVCWAAWNIGAINDLEDGMYFRWGALSPDGEGLDATDKGNISGTMNDAATMNWGEPWRMPTKAEYEELISKCSFSLETQHERIRVTGPNGNYIYFPFLTLSAYKYVLEGYSWYYWTGTVVPEEDSSYTPCGYAFKPNYEKGIEWPEVEECSKILRMRIRAVCPKKE